MGATGNHLIASLVNNKTVNEAKLFELSEVFFPVQPISIFGRGREKKSLWFSAKIASDGSIFYPLEMIDTLTLSWLKTFAGKSKPSRWVVEKMVSPAVQKSWGWLIGLDDSCCLHWEKGWRVWRSRPVHVFKEAILMLQRPKGSRLSIFTKVPWVVNKSLWWHHFSF